MKLKSLIIFVIVVLLSGCAKEFLDRSPVSDLSPENYFNKVQDLQLYINSLYGDLPVATDVYNESDDNIVKTTLLSRVQGSRDTPTSGGQWNWEQLRRINYFLKNYSVNGLTEDQAKPYLAAAHFFRAYFYFEKVKYFGDVPIYTEAIEANDDALLTKARDSRTAVMDLIISDLKYAIENLPQSKSIDQVTRWTALALMSRVGLYEGSFRKYHSEFNLPNADYYLNLCVEAAKTLMESGQYHIYTSNPDRAYLELFSAYDANDVEVILARKYSAALQIYHNVNYYTITASYGKPGLEKTLVNTYLMQDGSRFTDLEDFNKLMFVDEIQNRDLRLSQTIRTPGYTRIGQTNPLSPEFGASVTGYQLIKFVTGISEDSYLKSYNDIPIFRYAEVLLNFAEAKAELGTLTQSDLDQSIGLIRARVDMPNIDFAHSNAHPDPYVAAQYPNVKGANKGVILEIRRERRIELVMESFRWDDLMRWREGQSLLRPFKGMYFPGLGSYDLDGNNSIDMVIYTGEKPSEKGPQYFELGSEILLENGSNGGLVVVNPNIEKKFDESKDYFNPIPLQELNLNENLQQNKGWQGR